MDAYGIFKFFVLGGISWAHKPDQLLSPWRVLIYGRPGGAIRPSFTMDSFRKAGGVP